MKVLTLYLKYVGEFPYCAPISVHSKTLMYYINTYIYIYIYVISKNRAAVLYQDLKHEAIAECFRPDKARTASFLNIL